MKNDVWVKEAEWVDPKIEKSSDVIVKIGAAGVCRTDLHIIEGVWRHIRIRTISYCHALWVMKMRVGRRSWSRCDNL